ncbi:MAG: translocation/assembly module TamB domain-containing protein [Syntrophobacteraceae bacterium]
MSEKSKKSKFWRILPWAGLAAALFAAVPMLFLAFLSKSETGRGMVASRLTEALSASPDRRIVVGRLERLDLSDVRVASVVMEDAAGPWLTVENAVFRWSPLSLLRGRLHVKELSASLISVERAPSGGEPPSPPEKGAPGLIALPEGVPPALLDKLLVERLHLGTPLTGREADFCVEGRIVETAPGEGLRASLQLMSGGGGSLSRVDATVALHGAPLQLEVRAEVHEDAGGWIASLLGVKNAGALDATFGGDGILADWKGVFQGGVGGYGSLHSDIALQAGRALPQDFSLGMSGTCWLSKSLAPLETEQLIGGEAAFNVAARFGPGRFVAVDMAEASGAGFSLRLAGTFDMASAAVNGNCSLMMDDLGVLEPIVQKPIEGAMMLRAEAKGALREPRAEAVLEIDKARLADARANLLRVDLRMEPVEGGGASPGFRLKGGGEISGLEALRGNPLPESSLKWSIDVLAPSKDNVSIELCRIDGKAHHIEVKGHGSLTDPSALSGALDAVVDVDDLKPLTTFLGNAMGGSAHVEARLERDGAARTASGDLEGMVRGADGASALYAILGKNTDFSGRVDYRDGVELRVATLEATAQAFRLKGGAAFDIAGNTAKGEILLSVPDLAPFGALAKKKLGGSLDARVTANGALDAPECTVSIDGRSVSIDGTKFDSIHSGLNTRGSLKSPEGELQAWLIRGKQKLAANVDFLYKGREAALPRIELDAPGGRVRGSLNADLEKMLIEGTVNGKFSDLAALGNFLGMKMRGGLELDAVFNRDAGAQNVKASLKAGGLHVGAGGVSVGKADVAADVRDALEAPQGLLKVEVQDLKTPQADLTALHVRADGGTREARFDASVKGRHGQDFSLAAKGEIQRPGASDALRLTALEGAYGKYPLHLAQPVVLERSGGVFSLAGLDLHFGSARLRADGSLKPGALRASATLDGLPLDMAALFGGQALPGVATARVEASGSPASPTVDAKLGVTGLKPPGPEAAYAPATDVDAAATLGGGKMHVRAGISGPFETPALVELTAPLRFSLEPFAFDLPRNGNMEGKIQGTADLATLAAFAPREDHKVAGRLAIDLRMDGSMADPRASGTVGVENGSYQNLATGTVLKNLTISLSGDQRRLVIDRLSATDGGGGSISGRGKVEIDPAGSFPLDVDIRLSNATLVRMDEATATVDGNLSLSGNASKAALEGDVLIRKAEVSIPEKLPPSITDLDVVVINRPGEKAARGVTEKDGKGEGRQGGSDVRTQTATAAAPSPFALGLNVAVAFPNQVFVRGRGLDSEWKGDLHIMGTAASPSIKGVVSIVRGNLDFLDNRFSLEEGVIRFAGESPPAPTIDVKAEVEKKDVTALLLISGPASNPKLELQSDPVLPKDEILARVLFNRQLHNITPFQALRLANALRTLSGKGQGSVLDVVSNARKFLGVEQLELRDSGGGNGDVAVGVGKYLTEDVYVDLQQGVGRETGKARVEVEAHPNVTVESEVGVEGSTGMGVNWKLDY